VLQPLGITLHPMLDVFRAVIAIQDYVIGEMLEVNFVALPAAVEAEKQDNRAMHHRRDQDRPGGKCSGRTEESTLRCLVAARDAVAQHADEEARIQALFDPQQSIRPIRHDYRAGDLVVKRIEKASNILVVRDVHQHFERKVLLRYSERAQHLEATEMRAQKDAAFTALDLPVQDFLLMKRHVKVLELAP